MNSTNRIKIPKFSVFPIIWVSWISELLIDQSFTHRCILLSIGSIMNAIDRKKFSFMHTHDLWNAEFLMKTKRLFLMKTNRSNQNLVNNPSLTLFHWKMQFRWVETLNALFKKNIYFTSSATKFYHPKFSYQKWIFEIVMRNGLNQIEVARWVKRFFVWMSIRKKTTTT